MSSKSSFYNSTGVTNTQSNAIDASVDNAEASATASENSANNASASASTATTKASEASTSASTATTKASEASTSASTATTKASEASTSATTATTKASESATSATSSANSATAASTSASTATTKASEASSSASTALSHKNDAQTAKTAAETAETNAETAETNAASSTTAASTSASSASTSASTATTKAGEAATSASTATTKASEAATSASNASTAATTATTKASEASASASSAASSATAASASKDAALAALDSFDDRYLGVKSSNPSVDNDGNALVAGSLYFNSTDDTMKVYEGSTWVAAYASLSGALIAASNLSDLSNVATARANLGLGTAATTAASAYATAAQGTKADNALPKAGGTMSGDLSFGNNNKAIFNSDLEVYRTGTDAFIDEKGSGWLYIRGNNTVIGKYTGETYMKGIADGAVELYHNNEKRIETSATGVDVNGTVTADLLTVDASGEAILSLNGYTASQNTEVQLVSIREDTSTSKSILDIKTNNGTSLVKRARFDWDGDISFYEDTGTTAKLFWDASAESLGIGQGVFSGTQALNLKGEGIAIKNDKSGSNNNWSLIRNTGTASTSNISFVTGTGEAMVLAHNMNVGIGTSSPNALLHVGGTAETQGSQTNPAIQIGSTTGYRLGMYTDTEGGYIENKNGDNGIIFKVKTAGEAMRIDGGTGRVGIGRTPTISNSKLEVGGADNVSLINVEASGVTGGMGIGSTGLQFFHGSTARMRIDSSGNLLVGTTSTSLATTSSETGAMITDGSFQAAANNPVAQFNRITSDGAIANFRKDGTTVGSISTKSDDLVIHSSTTNHVGLSFGDGNVLPTNNYGTTSNNTVDLGSTSRRFKDLYLSGGVYLGGQGRLISWTIMKKVLGLLVGSAQPAEVGLAEQVLQKGITLKSVELLL